MIMRYADPFDALFAFQQALENRLSSDWLGGSTAGMGGSPPINVFQQGDDLVAIIELRGQQGRSQYPGKGEYYPHRRKKEHRLPGGRKSASARTAFRGIRPDAGRSDANRP